MPSSGAGMIAAMEDVRKSAEYADKSVLAACHTYGGDPYQPDVPLDYAMGVSTYPYVNFDFQTGVGNNGYNNNVSNIKKNIDKSLSVRSVWKLLETNWSLVLR